MYPTTEQRTDRTIIAGIGEVKVTQTWHEFGTRHIDAVARISLFLGLLPRS